MKSEVECENCNTDQGEMAEQGAKEKQQCQERQALHQRMGQIKHKILVLSGKGGVGKSTVAVNLAVTLARQGKQVGLLDVDIHGPSIPKMLNLEHQNVTGRDGALVPLQYSDCLKVMSIGFLLPQINDAVIWRGPRKYGAIKQFLKDVDWGELDYLIIDSPPGTGDEPMAVCELMANATSLVENATGALIVTTPQEVALADVRKSITFCRSVGMPVLGVLENMSGFVCPKCGEVIDIFKSGNAQTMAQEMGVPFLGSVPLDPQIVEAGDSGQPYSAHFAETESAKAFARCIRPLLESDAAIAMSENNEIQTDKGNGTMRIAIPLAEGKLALHFGHCAEFALIDFDQEQQKILSRENIPAPPHQPGLLPAWLAEQGANVIIAGGMGMRAQDLFRENKIKVIVGAPSEIPETIVQDFMAGTLQTGKNVCDH